jgi:hypothetical protein
MHPESENAYNALPDDHELVEHYKPTFFARGGDHLVYTVDDHPDVVIKASSFKIKDILSENIERGNSPDALTEEQRESLEQEIAEKNAQIRQLREYFGRDHTLPERRCLMKVPITKTLLDEIFVGDWKNRKTPTAAEQVSELWSTVIVQKRAEEIDDPNHLSFHFGSFLEERPPLDPEEYNKLNDVFISLKKEDPALAEQLFSLQDNPETHNLTAAIERAKTDPQLAQVLQELVQKMIGYAQDTGNILAMAGEDNIILHNREGQWNYLLVDALPVHNEPVFHEAQNIVRKYANSEILTKYEKTLLMKAMNFVRVTNGLAEKLGMEDRLHLLPDDIAEDITISDAIK